MLTDKDFTPTGLKIEGAYENDRNAQNRSFFKDFIREAYGCEDVIVAHHLVFEKEDRRDDGFTYQITQEVPSADTLLFDHDVAEKIWGRTYALPVLTRLAREPIATRDELAARMYYTRSADVKTKTLFVVVPQ